jgi:hypothetical protein
VIARSARIPSYRIHSASGQGVATFNGRDLYFGRHGDPTSRAAYDRTLAEWLANGRNFPSRPPYGSGSRTAVPASIPIVLSVKTNGRTGRGSHIARRNTPAPGAS